MTPLTDDPYEDLLGLWSDLETALALLLGAPLQVQGFAGKLEQLELWLQELIQHDSDAALYLMFQRASSSTADYSSSHALVCAGICQVLARQMQLPPDEARALVRAALTMNIAMHAEQNQLAQQREPMSTHQRELVARHALASQALLARLFIEQPLWLDVVARHHESPAGQCLETMAPADRLVRILGTVDRYAALISPRKSRAGRSAIDSLNTLARSPQQYSDETGRALMAALGLYPPGTYVRLDNGAIAVVLRQGASPGQPQIATVVGANGHSLYPPSLHQTSEGPPQVRSALARAAVTLKIDPRCMAQLGLYSTEGQPGLRQMVELPGAA